MTETSAGVRGRDRAHARVQEEEHAWPSAPLRGLHLGALWALAFVQPLFGLLGDNPAFFVARNNTPGDILLFAIGFALVPPLLFVLLEVVLEKVSPRLARIVHLTLVVVLAGALLGQIFKNLSPSPFVLFPIAIALGLLAMDAYRRLPAVRTLLSVLTVAPVVVLALLLFLSPVSGLVFGSDDAQASGTGTTSKTPVVLMIFDELPTISLMRRDQTIDAQRYPHFAKLGRSSTFYKNTTSVSDGTYVAVPAILTGKRPSAELPTSRTYPDNLYSLLGRTYDQFNQEPITKVCPTSLCTARERPRQKTRLLDLAADLKVVEGRLLLPEKLADTLPPIDRDWEDFAADDGDDGLAAASRSTGSTGAGGAAKGPITKIAGTDIPSERVRQARAVVAQMRPRDRGALYMVHNVIPHVPWRFLPNGAQYVVDGPTIPGLDDQTWKATPFQLQQAYQRDFLMTRFADNLLGEAITQMRSTGLWDKALVIVTADHGGAIGSGEERRPVTKENFGSVAGVPLFVKLPGQQQGKVSDEFTTTMDVVPTVAKTLGIKTDFEFDGIPVDEPRTPKLLQQRNGRDAKLVGLTPQQFVANRNARLARQDREFPSGDAALWRIGPRKDLLGKPVSALDVVAANGRKADIANSELYKRVRKGSGVIPAYVTGTLERTRAGTDVAVAVNGVVRATGKTYADGDEQRFSFVVDPRTLKRGPNRIQVLAVNRGTEVAVLGSAG